MPSRRNAGEKPEPIEAGEDLRQLLADLREEVRGVRNEVKTRIPNASPVPPKTITDISLEWLPRKLKKIAAPDTFDGRIRLHVLPALGSHTYETLRQAHVEDLMDAMVDGGFAPQTANHVRDAGRQLIQWALRNNAWAGSNPFEDTPKLDVPETIKDTLTREEAVTLLRYGIEPKWRNLFRLALYLGPRRKTIFHVRHDDVSLKRGLIDFRITKTGKPILGVPIPDRLFKYLRDIVRIESGWLFTQRDGRQLSGKSHLLNNVLARGVQRANITRQGRLIELTFHGLRRCSSTLHQQAGAHPWVVSKILGHSQQSLALFGSMVENMTAQRYTSFEEEFVRRELNKLNLEPE